MTADDFLTEIAQENQIDRRTARRRVAAAVALGVLLLALGVGIGAALFGGEDAEPPANPGVVTCGAAEDDCRPDYIGGGRWIITPVTEDAG